MDVPNKESRNEYLIESLINDEDINDYEPQSRNEQFLKDIIVGNPECTLEPETRSEALYKKLHKKVLEGGGGGITLKYIFDNCEINNHNAYYDSVYNDPILSNGRVGRLLSGLVLTYETLMNILNSIDFFNFISVDGILTYSIVTDAPEYIPYEWKDLSFEEKYNLSKSECPFQFLDKKIVENKKRCIEGKYNRYLPLLSSFTETYDAPLLDVNSLLYWNKLLTRRIDTLIINSFIMPEEDSWSNNFVECRQLVVKGIDELVPKTNTSFNNHFSGRYDGYTNPYELKDGKIFFPDNIVDSYKTATNWSSIKDNIFPLSDPSWHFNKIDIHNMYENETQHVYMVLNEFTIEPSVNILSSNENSITIQNIKISVDEISFDIISHDLGSSTLTINVNGEYSTQIIKDIVVGEKIEITLDNTAKEYFEDNGDGWYIAKKEIRSSSLITCKFNYTITENSFNRCRICVLLNDLIPYGCSFAGCVDVDGSNKNTFNISYSVADKRKCYKRYFTSKKLSSGNKYLILSNYIPYSNVAYDTVFTKGSKLQIRFE